MQQYFSLYLIYKPFNKNVIRLNYKITLLSSTIKGLSVIIPIRKLKGALSGKSNDKKINKRPSPTVEPFLPSERPKYHFSSIEVMGYERYSKYWLPFNSTHLILLQNSPDAGKTLGLAPM